MEFEQGPRLRNDFGADDMCCVFCGKNTLNCSVGVCVRACAHVCWELGKMLGSDSLISLILVNKAGRER